MPHIQMYDAWVARNPNKSRNKGRITQLKFIDLKIWKI